MTRSRENAQIRNRLIIIVLLLCAIVSLGFVVLGLAAIQVWEVTNSVGFCSDTCHDVHPEEPAAYQASYHAQVKCTECHMGRLPALQGLLVKTTHARHLPAVIFDLYERPLESETMRPADESCERCHSTAVLHDAAAREIRHFLTDEANTEKRTYLLLKTGASSEMPGGGQGIHWHIGNSVEYIATDDHKQEIRWVRATRSDGQTVEYNDALNPLSPEQIDRAEKQVMDCVDCHNRIGHPFPGPEVLLDQALADGRLSPDLPFAKQELLSVLDADYDDQAQALAAAEALGQRYQEAYPEVAAAYAAEIEAAVQLARELVPRVVFEAPGVTWQSFPDNVGHRQDAGCFRCHDGKHLSPEGEAIRLQCGLCHAIPVTVDGDQEPPAMALASRSQPDSHLDSLFVSDHRILADESCVECHGQVEYGDDDSSFCANSACHGRSWPVVDLNALLAHPVRLEGGHAEAECYTCHQGSAQIDYACANCHEPPGLAHYGDACQDCHTASGFQLASADGFLHPTALAGQHASLGCGSCHSTSGRLDAECSTCHAAPGDHLAGSCDTCHTAAGWVDSTVSLVARGGAIPHTVSAGDSCANCHDPAGRDWPAPADHKTYDDAQCTLCHSLGGSISLDSSHEGVVGLMQGQHTGLDCVQCHEDGALNTPATCYACHQADDNHRGALGQDCAACHTPAGWESPTFDHARTDFALLGRHRSVSCSACHGDGTYDGTPQACIDCHQQDDQHDGQFGQDCARCHTIAGWAGASIDHSLTTFPLTGAHLGADCAQCHPGGAYEGTPQNCFACHQQDDQHNGQFGQDCAQCHTTKGWPGATIDHNLTGFPLTGAHVGADCAQCHPGGTYDGTPQNCFACHAANDKHNGQFGQDCAQCHTTNGWPGATVDHNLTGFPLTGAHVGADCAACHPGGTYAGTPQNCFACHQQDDQHNGQFGQDCAQCHTPNGWEGANVDHNLTGFPLIGVHTTVACAQCHPGGTYDGTPQDCFACHQQDDQHNGQFGQDCAQCHTPNGWDGASIDHNLTSFPLTGAHVGADCAQCHPGGAYEGTPQNCFDCHQQDDQHNGQFGQDCAQCHTTNGWPGASIDHNLTGFPLTGAHIGADCAACHPGGTYEGTPQNCLACHQQDDQHNGQFGQDCAQCHTTNGWPGASIDHNLTAFPLTGEHVGAACAQCHPGGTYAGTPQNCFACHGGDDEHNGQFGQDCAQCHTPNGWEGASIDHNLTSFPLTGAHVGADCAACHPGGTYAGTPQNCFACHQQDDQHNGQFGQDCAQCHTPDGWGGASVDHNLTNFPLTGAHTAVACNQCHPGGVYQGTPTACAACHGEPGYHAGQFGTDCAACHTPNGWLPAAYNQTHTFPLGHGGAGSSCRTCHPSALGDYTCYACHDPDDVGDEHDGDYSNCVMCHPTGEEDRRPRS